MQSHIEKQWNKSGYVWSLLDIEGAFDSTSQIIIQAARWEGLQRYNLSVGTSNPL
jgi:hypothetical protein